MVSVLGGLLELEPSGARASAQGEVGGQPALVEDDECFDSQGKLFILQFFLGLRVTLIDVPFV